MIAKIRKLNEKGLDGFLSEDPEGLMRGCVSVLIVVTLSIVIAFISK